MHKYNQDKRGFAAGSACILRLRTYIYYLTTFFQSSYGRNEELFLFSTILEASMMDKKFGEKAAYFELSMGNAGNVIDGHNETYQEYIDSDGEDNLGENES